MQRLRRDGRGDREYLRSVLQGRDGIADVEPLQLREGMPEVDQCLPFLMSVVGQPVRLRSCMEGRDDGLLGSPGAL